MVSKTSLVKGSCPQNRLPADQASRHAAMQAAARRR